MLLSFVCKAKVEEYHAKMFASEHINTPEDCAVLHATLCNFKFNNFKIMESGVDKVSGVLTHMKEFTEAVWNSMWKGYTGKTINTIMSNIDRTHIAETLRVCNPETMLCTIASKFHHVGEITNTETACSWFLICQG